MANARKHAQGLSLLEVVLALAILAGAFATLAQLVGIGVRAAGHGRDLTQGQIIAETMMSEIGAGLVLPSGAGNMPVATNPDWNVSVLTQNTALQGVIQVTVIAERDPAYGRPALVEVTRWMRDPNLAIPTEDDSSSASSSSSTGTGSTSGSSGGTSGTGSGTGTSGGTGGSAGGAAGGGTAGAGANAGGGAVGGASPGGAPNNNSATGGGRR